MWICALKMHATQGQGHVCPHRLHQAAMTVASEVKVRSHTPGAQAMHSRDQGSTTVMT